MPNDTGVGLYSSYPYLDGQQFTSLVTLLRCVGDSLTHLSHYSGVLAIV